MGEPDRAPDLRDVLEASDAGWGSQAACRDEPDASLFLFDRTLPRQPGLPTIALSMLICSRCPVRGKCLRESLRPLVIDVERFSTSPRDGHVSAAFEHDTHALRAAGMWGGSSEINRMQVAHLPVEVAAETLEASFPKRLGRVVAAFRRNGSRFRPHGRSRAARLLAMPEEQQVATVVPVTGPRRCNGCGERLPALARSDARYCSVRCRVAAHRARAA